MTSGSLAELRHSLGLSLRLWRPIDLKANLANNPLADNHLEAMRTWFAKCQRPKIHNQIAGLQKRAWLVRHGHLHTLHPEHLLPILIDKINPHRTVRAPIERIRLKESDERARQMARKFRRGYPLKDTQQVKLAFDADIRRIGQVPDDKLHASLAI